MIPNLYNVNLDECGVFFSFFFFSVPTPIPLIFSAHLTEKELSGYNEERNALNQIKLGNKVPTRDVCLSKMFHKKSKMPNSFSMNNTYKSKLNFTLPIVQASRSVVKTH